MSAHRRRRVGRAAQGARRCAARPAHAADRAGVVGADGAAGAGRAVGAGAALESRAEQREVRSPASSTRRRCATTSSARPTPSRRRRADYEARLRRATARATRWSWCPPGFEAALLRGDAPVVEMVTRQRQPARRGGRRRGIERLLRRLRAASARRCSLALRGVSPAAAGAGAGRGARPRQHADARAAQSPACCRSS